MDLEVEPVEIRVKNLYLEIGGRRILEDISLDVGQGELVGIIGPNGSGKSSLLKTIYRLVKPSRGQIYFNNRPMEEVSLREAARKIAVVAQNNDYDFDFTVYDMVLMGRTPHKKLLEGHNEEDHELVRAAIGKVGMEDFINRSFRSLSGGERQRIILARALAQDTDCLILDEPTNHLDIKYQFEFMNIARELGITVLAVIHDLNIASLYCDRIYGLKEGRLVASGRPSQIISPELIRELYGIEAEVNQAGDRINIVYKPF